MEADIGLIRQLLKENPGWNRSRPSRELCEQWAWRNGKGRLKDMAARTLLLKLERARGEHPASSPPCSTAQPAWIGAWPRRRCPTYCIRGRGRPEPVASASIERLNAGDDRLALFNYLLHRYHYLGHQRCAGENLKAAVSDHRGDCWPVCCSVRRHGKPGTVTPLVGWDRATRETAILASDQ